MFKLTIPFRNNFILIFSLIVVLISGPEAGEGSRVPDMNLNAVDNSDNQDVYPLENPTG